MTLFLIFLIFLLVAVNGFFVASEFALVRASRGRLENDCAEGLRGAEAAVAQQDNLRQYLSACQFGITLASLGIGFLGEPAIASLLEPLLGAILARGVAVALAVAIAYILVTSLHVIAGEQVPKIFAIVKAESVARRCAQPLNIFEIMMRPFIAGLNGASNSILRLMRIDPNATFDEGGTPEDIKLLISQAQTGGHLDLGEAQMLGGVFHLHEKQARQVMTPVPLLTTIDISDTSVVALRACISSGHTRIVVTENHNTDLVRGTVHTNSLAELYIKEGPDASFAHLVRDVLIIPETKPLDDLLADLQKSRSTLAVVIDEYGRVVGVVTVEDIIEEVVGEIDDETDVDETDVRPLDGGGWMVRGHVLLADLPDFGIDLGNESVVYTSLSGLIFHNLGKGPAYGDTIKVNDYNLRVESVKDNRITSVLVKRNSSF